MASWWGRGRSGGDITYFAPSKFGLLGVRGVEHQVRRDRLDPDVDAAPPGRDRRLDRIVVAGVDDVDVRAGQLGKRA